MSDLILPNSNPRGNLSRTGREISALQQKIAGYEQQRREYYLLLTYLIRTNNGEFLIDVEKMKSLEPCVIEMVTVMKDGKRYIRLVEIQPPNDPAKS